MSDEASRRLYKGCVSKIVSRTNLCANMQKSISFSGAMVGAPFRSSDEGWSKRKVQAMTEDQKATS